MPKPRQTLRIRIPPYQYPRTAWRRSLHAQLDAEATRRSVAYGPKDKLELIVVLYLDALKLNFHDVDNRLKDIMDALQGRAGGSKSTRPLRPIVPNDHQIWRVLIEKRLPPGQSHGMGHLVVRKFRDRAIPRPTAPATYDPKVGG